MLVLFKIRFDAFDNADRGAGIDEVSSADSDSSCAGDKKFYGVFGFENAAHTDDG